MVDESIPLFVVTSFMRLFSKPVDELNNYEIRKNYQPHLASPLKGEEEDFIICIINDPFN